MAFFVLNKCCFCIDLRKATLFYAFFSLIVGVISLGASGIVLKLIRSAYKHMDHSTEEAKNLWNNFLLIAANIVLLFADLWITLDLIYGLYFDKRDKFRKYVWTSFLVFALRLALVTFIAILLCNQHEEYRWLIITCSTVFMAIYLYFLVIIRSYYYKTEDQGSDMETPVNVRYDYDNIHL